MILAVKIDEFGPALCRMDFGSLGQGVSQQPFKFSREYDVAWRTLVEPLLEELWLLVVLELGSVEYVEGSDEKVSFSFELSCCKLQYTPWSLVLVSFALRSLPSERSFSNFCSRTGWNHEKSYVYISLITLAIFTLAYNWKKTSEIFNTENEN